MVMVLMPGPAKWDSGRMIEEGKLRSESIFRDDRRYYLDLKENHRGRFLRVNLLHGFIFYNNILHSSTDNFTKSVNIITL